MEKTNILQRRIDLLELENKILKSQEITNRIEYYKMLLSEYKRYGKR